MTIIGRMMPWAAARAARDVRGLLRPPGDGRARDLYNGFLLPMPPLPAALAAFLEGPNSIVVATQNGALVPAIAHAFGLRCDAPAGRVFVYMPTQWSGPTLDNLQKEPRIAITSGLPSTHRTIQLKGRAVRVAPTPEDERARVDARFAAFMDECERSGMPRRLLARVTVWPSTTVEVDVDEIFDQTPGPGAGERFSDEARA